MQRPRHLLPANLPVSHEGRRGSQKPEARAVPAGQPGPPALPAPVALPWGTPLPGFVRSRRPE